MIVANDLKFKLSKDEEAALAEVRQLHEEAVNAHRIFQARGRRIAYLLQWLKRGAGHGNWRAFIRQHLPLDESTAWRYIRRSWDPPGLDEIEKLIKSGLK